MGRSNSTQQALDEEIGVYLAEFQKKLTGHIESAYVSRIDKLRQAEEHLSNQIGDLENIIEKNQQFVNRAEFKMTMGYMAAGAVGGGIGAMVVVLCLVWMGLL